MNVLCIGKSSWSITIPIDRFINEGEKHNYMKSYGSIAGSGTSIAYLLCKWGINTIISTMVGSDDYGSKIKKEFTDLHAKIDYIETAYDKSTNVEMNFINDTTKIKTTIEVTSDSPVLKKYNYDFTPDIIFTDCFDYGASQNSFSKYANVLNIVGASNMSPEVLELCKYAKTIICNREFAEYTSKVKISIDNPQSLVDAYNGVQNKYPNANIVLTLDINGAVYQKNNEIKIMPGLNTEVLDRTGAGDAFKAAYIYGLLNNFDMDKIIIMANIAAGITVSRIGSHTAFPSISEVMDLYNQKMGVSPVPQQQTPVIEQPTQQVPPQPNVTQSVQPTGQN